MTAHTILYIPPADRPAILAPSVGGAYPPMSFQDGAGVWRVLSAREIAADAFVDYPRALVLSVGGTPDAIGMGRAIEILGMAVIPTSSRITGGLGFTFGRRGREEWSLKNVAGEEERFPCPEPERAGMLGIGATAWALATILAARIGGSVVVVDG